MQFKYRKCITIFNVHTLDIIKSNVMVYVLYLRLIYYIHVHVVCILLCMEGQISLAIDCIFTEWISDRDHVIWGSEVMGAEIYELLFFLKLCVQCKWLFNGHAEIMKHITKIISVLACRTQHVFWFWNLSLDGS